MKKCKILLFKDQFNVPIGRRNLKNKYNRLLFDYPDAQAILEEYLNAGWVVKNMCGIDPGSGEYDYAFYLERDI